MTNANDPATDLALHCPECDYNLTGATGDRCPWCGWEIDVDTLAAAASEKTLGRRIGAILACLVLGIGSLIAMLALTSQTGRLSLQDRVVVMGVLAASLGHLGLAVLLAARRRYWPLRNREAGTLLRYVAWFSITAGVIGATALLRDDPPGRLVRGVPVTDAFDFVLAALLYTLPGATLLIMKMVTFRHPPAPPRTIDRSAPPATKPPAERAAAPFVVQFTGRFDAAHVQQLWSDTPQPSTPAVEALIVSAWNLELQRAEQTGRVLYDGKLARLVDASAQGDHLGLELGPTTYRAFVGTHVHNLREVRQAGTELLANAVGVSAAVITRDGYLALGRRSDRVAFHAGYVHPFGGMVEITEAGRGQRADVFDAVIREVCEELGVRRHEIGNVTLIALARDRSLHQPELIFDLELKFSREELCAVFDSDLSDGEHTAVAFVHDDPETVLPFLDEARPVTPIAEAAILLHGRSNWGVDWYEQTCYVRYGELPPAASPDQPETAW